MAGVAAGISHEVVLVLGLGLPKLAGWNDFGHGFGRPQPRCIDIGNRILGDPTLLVSGVEDR